MQPPFTASACIISCKKTVANIAPPSKTYYTHTMKNVLLCGLNARYSHSALALMCLKYAAGAPDNLAIAEYTINQPISEVVADIVRRAPCAVGFSCYIWNSELIWKVASTIRRILPGCFLFFGGPEVSYDTARIMDAHPYADMVIRGPGEIAFSHLMRCLDTDQPITQVPSACIRQGGDIVTTADAPPFELNNLPFMYGDLSLFRHRIIYYETSRGCPYRCAYCMSADQPVSFLPIARVKKELGYFMAADVRQVKLVDRTFNHPAARAYEIFEALIDLSQKYLQSSTCFHFEIAAYLLDKKTMALLGRARKGLFQFEIGIQSTHPATLRAVNRHHDTRKLLENTQALCRLGNAHVHADLIAGLPYETPATFAQSFNDAYSVGPNALQLGFLKVLPGAPIRDITSDTGIIFTDYPPYEVLATQTMSYETLAQLHRIARLVDTLHNTAHFQKTLGVLIPAFETPFAFFDGLRVRLEDMGYFDRTHSLAALFDMLYLFAKDVSFADIDNVREALMFDWLCIEKPKTWPKHIAPTTTPEEKVRHRRFFQNPDAIKRYLPAYEALNSGSIASRCVIHTFEHLFAPPAAVLFDYGKKAGDDAFRQIISAGDL